MTVRQRYAAGAAAAAAGAVLFALAIRNVGWSDVADGIRRVGWGLLPILALAGLRFVLRAEAWRRCMPAAVRIPFPQALAAYLAGDAIGNVTPLGLIASEPTKVFLTRHRLATGEAASSLALDVVVYALSAVAMIAIGLVALLLTLSLPLAWRIGAMMAVVALAVGVAAAWRLAGGTWDAARGPRPRWRGKLAALRESLLASAAAQPGRLWTVLTFHALFHVCAFLEVFVTLRWLLPPSLDSFGATSPAAADGFLGSGGPTLAQALIFSALDRAVIILFKFVPFRIGVDEASSGGMAALLGWGAAAGVSLAVVKKVRSLFWTGVGLVVMAAHPAQAGRATDRRESARAHRT